MSIAAYDEWSFRCSVFRKPWLLRHFKKVALLIWRFWFYLNSQLRRNCFRLLGWLPIFSIWKWWLFRTFSLRRQRPLLYFLQFKSDSFNRLQNRRCLCTNMNPINLLILVLYESITLFDKLDELSIVVLWLLILRRCRFLNKIFLIVAVVQLINPLNEHLLSLISFLQLNLHLFCHPLVVLLLPFDFLQYQYVVQLILPSLKLKLIFQFCDQCEYPWR